MAGMRNRGPWANASAISLDTLSRLGFWKDSCADGHVSKAVFGTAVLIRVTLIYRLVRFTV